MSEHPVAPPKEDVGPPPKARMLRMWRNTGIRELETAVAESNSRLKLCQSRKRFMQGVALDNRESSLRSAANLWSHNLSSSLVMDTTAYLDVDGAGDEEDRMERVLPVEMDSDSDGENEQFLSTSFLGTRSSLDSPGAPETGDMPPRSPDHVTGVEDLHPAITDAMKRLDLNPENVKLFLEQKEREPSTGNAGSTKDPKKPVEVLPEEGKHLDFDMKKRDLETLSATYRKNFLITQEELKKALEDDIRQRNEIRVETYVRKSKTCPTFNVGSLNVSSWELRAQYSKVKEVVSNMDSSRWWNKLVAHLHHISKEGTLTPEQEIVLHIIVEMVEAGEEMAADDLLSLCIILPPAFHELDEIQAILTFLREEVVRMPVTDYKMFLERQGLYIPVQVANRANRSDRR